MQRQRTSCERLTDKSFEKLFSLKLINDYALSPIEAQTLTSDIKHHLDNSNNSYPKEGQVLFTAVLADEPAGKPLIKCKTKQIKLEVYPSELIELFNKNLKVYAKQMVQRLCWQALDQGCTLTQEDLSRLLHCSVTRVRRLIAEYRKDNIYIPTRGNYCDIGPGVSHKSEAIKRYLKGYTVTEIARSMAHTPQSIERYLDDFSLVMTAYVNDQYTALRISQMMRLSEKLVKEYIDIYNQFKDDSDCQYRLEQIQLRSANLFERCKKNRGKDQ
ncbi:MAG: DUF1670 domain-containing protein [Candidatus Helarchaeota archaeon]